MMKILFVCTGNTCRSPMAEAIYNDLSQGSSNTGFSRGTGVFIPQKTSPKSILALKNLGVDFQPQKSVQVGHDDIENADIVLTMEQSHKMALKVAFPEYKSKIFTLLEKVYGNESDIFDPYGMSQEEYDKCAKQIYDAVERLVCLQ